MISWDKLGQAIEWRIRTLHRRSPDLSTTPSLFHLTKQHRRRARDKPLGLVLRMVHYMDDAGAHPTRGPLYGRRRWQYLKAGGRYSGLMD